MSPRLHANTVVARLTVTSVAAIAVAAAISGCAPRSRRTPDDTLIMLIDAPVKATDPRFAVTNNDLKVSRLVAPGLVAVDTADMSPRLELAEKIVRVDDVTWDAVLRPGLRFSDGAPVTAADVAWTYETVMADGSPSLFHKQLSERFSSVEVVDERTARFHLRSPLATMMTDIDFGIVARHAAGADGRFAGGAAIGAGPYRVEALESTRVVLAANPHYHGDKPRVPRVEIRAVRDQSARMLMLVGGSADLVQNAVRLDLLDDVARRPRIHIDAAPSAILSYLMMNNDDPVLRDVRVRQAIALALDRPRVIAAKLGGHAVPATGLLAPGHWAYTPDVERWEHDADRARRLLDEAGLRDPDGPGPLPRVRLTYKTSSDQFRVAIARVLAAQLGEVGIDVDVRAFEFATFFADIKKGQYQLASMQTTDISEPDFYLTYFHSDRIPSKTDPDAGNRWRYRNARVDELTVQGRTELDRDRRLALYAEVQRIIAHEVPVVPLWHEDNVVVANRDITGYTITPNARLSGLVTTTKQR